MTKEEAVEALTRKGTQEVLRWVVSLGCNLTVAARGAYPQVQSDTGHLVGFNEVQHQLYNFLRHPLTADPWPIADLLEAVYAKAEHYGITDDLKRAVERSFAQ